MNFPLSGAALLRAVPGVIVVAGLALSAGCASYSRKPLLADEYYSVLEQRLSTAPELIEAIGDDAYAPADGLSLHEAELLCLYLNPRLRSVRLEAGVEAASARFAGLWDDPEIGADAIRILEGGDEPWIYGASLSFSIPISGRLAVAKSQAEAKARAALVEAWIEEQQVLLELRQAWADWEAASRSLSITRRLHSSLSELVQLTNRREELGELIAAEAVAFRLAEARLGLDRDQLLAEETEARFRVLELMGLLPLSDVTLASSNNDPARFEATDGAEDFERTPAVILAAARYEAAEERLRLEVRKQYPDITLGPLFENEEGMDRLGVGFSVPIPILNANKQGIAEANAARDAARSAWEQAVQEALASIASNDLALAAASQRLEVLRTTIVPLAEDQVTQARTLADLGEINTLLILEALESEREAALDLIEARAALQRTNAERLSILPDSIPSFNLKEEGRK